jgi:hypothetical protein
VAFHEADGFVHPVEVFVTAVIGDRVIRGVHKKNFIAGWANRPSIRCGLSK